MVLIHDREEEVLDAPRKEKPCMVTVKGGIIEEVPNRRVINERGRGSTLNQWKVSLIGPVMGEAEEPVQEEMRIWLDQDEKQLSDLRGDDQDEVMVPRQKVGLQSLLRKAVMRAPIPNQKTMRRKGASETMISVKGSPART